jgi:hypothetical protein
LKEGTKNLPSESPIRLMANPKKIKDISAPPFSKLPASFRRGLEAAKMRALALEDEDLVGLTGAELYDEMGPLRKACLLNLVAKATHPSADRVSRFVRAPMVLRQDRCFVEVDPAMHDALCKSERFKSAPGALHEAPEGFERMDSFKSKDAHANLQVTFMRNVSSGVFWADVDIDEAGGIEHGFEVIRNTVTDGRTNPFFRRVSAHSCAGASSSASRKSASAERTNARTGGRRIVKAPAASTCFRSETRPAVAFCRGLLSSSHHRSTAR